MLEKIMDIGFKNNKYDIYLNTNERSGEFWHEARYSSKEPPGQFCTKEKHLHDLISILIQFETLINRHRTLTDEVFQEILDKVASISCVEQDCYWIIDKGNKSEKELVIEVITRILKKLSDDIYWNSDRIEDYKKADINTLDELEKFITSDSYFYDTDIGGEWFEYAYIFDKLIIGYTS